MGGHRLDEARYDFIQILKPLQETKIQMITIQLNSGNELFFFQFYVSPPCLF